MLGDFSRRDTGRDPTLHGVLHQQGKVLLDSDWNTQTQITLAWQDQAGADTIGTGVAAVPAHLHDSFTVLEAQRNGGAVDLTVGPGRVWVDGMLVHLAGAANVTRRATYLKPPIQDPAHTVDDIEPNRSRDAVVLEVWREAVNGFQVPEDLIEPALGGPDTTERVHTATAFRLYRMAPADTCANLYPKLQDDFSQRGRLRVSLQPTVESDGDCPVVHGGGYTGFEHRLYRIEIARTKLDVHAARGTLFKWSQFNGGLVGRGIFRSHADGASLGSVTVTANLQAIMTSGLEEGYLEAVEYRKEPGRWRVTFGCAVTLNNQEITLLSPAYYGTIPSPDEPVFFRLWDGIEPVADYPPPIPGNSPVELQCGIRLEFDADPNRRYVPGDYWSFSVRAGNIGNPDLYLFDLAAAPAAGAPGNDLKNAFAAQTLPLSDGASVTAQNGQWTITDPVHNRSFVIKGHQNPWRVYGSILVNNEPPQGTRIRRVPLAILQWTGAGTITFEGGQIHDCRRIIRPLTCQNICCTFVVGDGVTSHGQFDSIEEAIRHLPDSGGQICLLPGDHRTNATITNRHHIRFVGCHTQTIVRPVDAKEQASLFHITNATHISFEDMDLVHPNGTVFAMAGSEGHPLAEISIVHTRMLAYKHAVHVDQGRGIRIRDNVIRMLNRQGGGVAIYLQGEDSAVADNDIGLFFAIDMPPAEELPPVPPRPFDPCADPNQLFADFSFLLALLRLIWAWRAAIAEALTYQTLSGIQIGCGSERIEITGNRILGGAWNGITLGHVPSGVPDVLRGIRALTSRRTIPPAVRARLEKVALPGLNDILIQGNRIRHMGLNGIGVVDVFEPQLGLLVSAENMTIRENEIQDCLRQAAPGTEAVSQSGMAFGGIVLGDCENLLVRENRIEDNGSRAGRPVCGIFVFFGDKVDISNNRVVNNGPRQLEAGAGRTGMATNRAPAFFDAGMSGGIVVRLSLKDLAYELVNQKEVLQPDGIPVVKVHDNIVVQPQGHALLVMAMGPVSVIGNQLTSQGVDPTLNPLSFLAGSVIILDLGISKDLAAAQLLTSLAQMTREQARATHAAAPAAAAAPQPFLLLLPSGNVQFTDNQVTLDLRAPELSGAVSSQLIVSLDDVCYATNQSQCHALVDALFVDVILFGTTVRTVGCRFEEGATLVVQNSLLAIGLLMNTCTGNQATHCLLALPLARAINEHNLVLYGASCPYVREIAQGQLARY